MLAVSRCCWVNSSRTASGHDSVTAASGMVSVGTFRSANAAAGAWVAAAVVGVTGFAGTAGAAGPEGAAVLCALFVRPMELPRLRRADDTGIGVACSCSSSAGAASGAGATGATGGISASGVRDTGGATGAGAITGVARVGIGAKPPRDPNTGLDGALVRGRCDV